MADAAPRKLAAILMADVVNYSRLMGADEQRTVDTLRDYRGVFTSYISKFRGRVVDAKGDALMAEFGAVSDALSGAIEIQRELSERNADLPADSRMEFRIGINLGEVLVENDEIYGDGVNVAARLESLAEPGGIWISRTAHDQVDRKLPFQFEYMGEQVVKNIDQPVRAYRVLSRLGAAAHRVVRAKRDVDKLRILAAVALCTLGGAVLLIGLTWYVTNRSQEDLSVPGFPAGASVDPGARRSLAVLPFVNMSGDPEQEYFSDGITETIITDLSKLRNLNVIARNSSFQYKGQSVDLREIARDLGAAHILEGSVQKSGNRIRINAQLIHGDTGEHAWAGRWDRELKDIFAVQDDITHKIVEELDVVLVAGEQARLWRRSTENTEAYDLFLRVPDIRPRTKADHDRVRPLLERAIELDPNFAPAYVRLGFAYDVAAFSGWADDPALAFTKAVILANRALEIDPELGEAYVLLMEVMMFQENQAHAMEYAARALELNPNSADMLAMIAIHTSWTGDLRGLEYAQRALRLNPHPPDWYMNPLGISLLVNKRYEEAAKALERCVESFPDYIFCHVNLALSYIGMGREADAQSQIDQVRRINPAFHTGSYTKGFVHPEDKRYYREQLQRVGLP